LKNRSIEESEGKKTVNPKDTGSCLTPLIRGVGRRLPIFANYGKERVWLIQLGVKRAKKGTGTQTPIEGKGEASHMNSRLKNQNKERSNLSEEEERV